MVAPLALVAAPASAQMRPATLGEIFESYNDCLVATASGRLDPAELERLGWKLAAPAPQPGQAPDAEPIIYNREDRATMILLSRLGRSGACIVSARIESFQKYEDFRSAFGDSLPPAGRNGATTYRAKGRTVQMAPAGTSDRPGLRLVVATPVESTNVNSR
ncbi:MAG: hypothetical protein B7X57_06345 [Erythrobacter sp. 34-65-8]|nr:MAG: hypothetical protein B7X57_06345 [Erythrobacter sp. 34-65-8]